LRGEADCEQRLESFARDTVSLQNLELPFNASNQAGERSSDEGDIRHPLTRLSGTLSLKGRGELLTLPVIASVVNLPLKQSS